MNRAAGENSAAWMAQSQPVLDTQRLRLRPYRDDDAHALEPLVSLREIAATTLAIPHPYPRGGAADWLSRRSEEYRTGKAIHFAVTLREQGELIGSIGLHLKGPILPGIADLGYWIAPTHWNKGFGTEAVAAVLQWGFQFLQLHRIEAHHFANNPASGRLMQKNGMTCEGHMRERVLKWGEWLDIVLYAILRREWEAMQRK
jgi:ribosomal-protein-alanine N-acetyltransferase